MKSNYSRQVNRILILCVSLFALGAFFAWGQKEMPAVMLRTVLEDSSIRFIYTIDDYLDFAASVSAGNTYAGEYVNLMSDLDFSGVTERLMIGQESDIDCSFQGIFDGNGHRFSNLYIQSDGEAGLFYELDGTICNLVLESGNMEGSICGAFAAVASENARILNCSSMLQFYGEVRDGFTGNGYGIIQNCYNEFTPLDVDTLNQGLCGLSGISEINEWFFWEEEEGRSVLSGRTANTLKTMYANYYVNNEKISIQAFYSYVEEAWCFAFPAKDSDLQLDIFLAFSDGNTRHLVRSEEQPELFWEEDNIEYPIRFLSASQIPVLFIQTDTEDSLTYLHEEKDHRLNGRFVLLNEEGNVLNSGTLDKISGHGNDSWKAPKKSYNLSFSDQVNLLDMGASKKYVLLAGYRDNSLLAYKVTNDLAKEIGMDYAPKTEFIHLYVDGNYLGMYFLTGRIEIGENRFNLKDLKEETKKVNSLPLESYNRQEWKCDETHARRVWFDMEHEPEDITGGYILEMDKENYDPIESRFVSDRNLSMVLRSMPYASYNQINYIADYWQDFEDALYSEDGYNKKGKYYSEYIHTGSFADQWLFYELNEENSMGSSVYFYKDSDQYGDGLLHASYLWDMEHSLNRSGYATYSWIATTRTESDSYWNQFYRHEDFAKKVYEEWMEKFVPALEKLLRHCDEEDFPETNMERYLAEYGEAGKLNNIRWEECSYEAKWERIFNILTFRKDFLTKALSLYNTEYKYFYEEDGVFYGVLESEEAIPIVWDGEDI